MNFLKEDTGILQQYKSIYLEQKSSKEEIISKLTNFLEGGLKQYAKDFVDAGEQYNVDPFLTASIAMLETGRGTAPVLTKNKNVSGRYDTAKGTHYTYSNIRDSIFDQARFLRSGYLDKGLTTFKAIGDKYAPPGAANDPKNTNKDWPVNVSRLYAQATGSSNLPYDGEFPEEISDTRVAATNTDAQQQPIYRTPAEALAGLIGCVSQQKQAATGKKQNPIPQI